MIYLWPIESHNIVTFHLTELSEFSNLTWFQMLSHNMALNPHAV